MCNNFPNIRITEGNNFSLVLPLRSRTYVATKPIDEDIDPEQLENVVVTFGGVEYPAQITAQGVQIDLPATLAVGTYNILLTAEYLESSIRAAYESAVTIVPWSAQSTAEQYITGSPIVMRAAYVLSGSLTDAELEALKQEYREKIAEAEQAKEEAEQAKAEWEQKAADLDGVAKQGDNPDATNTAILEAVQQGGGTEIAKESTSQQILTKIGSPAQGQGADLFAAMRDIALSATTLQELADSWRQMVTDRNSIDGFEFVDTFNLYGTGDLLANRSQIKSIVDSTTRVITSVVGAGNLHYIEYKEVETISVIQPFSSSPVQIIKLPKLRNVTVQARICNSLANLQEFYAPITQSIGDSVQAFGNCPNLRIVDLSNIVSISHPSGVFNGSVKLIDLRLGALVDRTSLFSWSPTEALLSNSQTLLTEEDIAAGFTSNLEKLLYNIREHIAENLQVAPYTITFSAEVKAAILADQPTADAFTNKGWTIA